MDPKQRAAEAALAYVSSDTAIGLGTGSTFDFFLPVLADALKSGRLKNVVGVPTSERTAQRADELGIPIRTLMQIDRLDVDIDGADEVTPELDLIKGLGGALLREKVVAQHAWKLIIVADASKRVAKLGTRSPLPVEVVVFEHEAHARFLATLGCEPVLRMTANGSPFRTDNGNYLYDCRFPHGIDHPKRVERALQEYAGVVESGLFLRLAKVALIGDDETVHTLTRSA